MTSNDIKKTNLLSAVIQILADTTVVTVQSKEIFGAEFS